MTPLNPLKWIYASALQELELLLESGGGFVEFQNTLPQEKATRPGAQILRDAWRVLLQVIIGLFWIVSSSLRPVFL